MIADLWRLCFQRGRIVCVSGAGQAPTQFLQVRHIGADSKAASALHGTGYLADGSVI